MIKLTRRYATSVTILITLVGIINLLAYRHAYAMLKTVSQFLNQRLQP